MISPLRQSDEVSIRAWARDYLRDYMRRRAEAWALVASDAEIDEHIDENELESALWQDIIHADYAEHEFVGVARKGNAPLGLVLLTTRIEPYFRESVAELRWIYVAEAARRSGVGKALLEEARVWSERQGIKIRQASVPADNPARKLYEAAGFKAIAVSLGAPVTL